MVAQTSSSTTENGIFDTTTISSFTVDVPSGLPPQESTKTSLSSITSFMSNWSTKTWNGLTSFSSKYIWTDGTNIYYSDDSEQYVQYILNKTTVTWITKSWVTPLIQLDAKYIWTDETDIYYSNGNQQYVLDKSEGIWIRKSWLGSNSFSGECIWSDGTNIYYSSDTYQYVLDKSTSTWSTKSWSGLTNFYGTEIWSDGTDIYRSSGTYQYVLSKTTPTITSTSYKPKFE